GVGGVSDNVVDSSRVVVARCRRAAAEPLSRGGGAAGPESLDRLGTALCRSRRAVARGAGPIVLLPGTGLEQWAVRLRADGVAGATAVPARFQPPDDGRHPAQALWRALARRRGEPPSVLHRSADAPPDRQGLPHLSPRPGPVGAGGPLQRPDDSL